jgi:putative membrane protein
LGKVALPTPRMNTYHPLRRIAFALAALSIAAGSHAADTSLKHGDKTFLEKAGKSGMEEVAISQAALPHLQNAQAKEFAQMMVSDHTGANRELMALAAKKGVTLPAKQPDTKKWDKKKEKGYDEDYMEKMVKDHDDAVDLFTKASKNSDDADVKAFAAKTLPTLQAHHAKAKSIKKTLK